MLRVVRPAYRILRPRRLLSLRPTLPLLAPRARRPAAATNVKLEGPLHKAKKTSKPKKKATKAKSKRKAAKPKPLTLSTQLRQARAGLSSDAKRALEPTPSAFNLYIKEETSGQTGTAQKEVLGDAAKKWKSMSDGDKTSYTSKAEQVKAEKDRVVQGLSDADKQAIRAVIKLENRRITEQTRKDGKKRSKVRRPDIRVGAQKTSPYAEFVAQHYGDSDVQAVPPTDRFRKLAEKWKQSKA